MYVCVRLQAIVLACETSGVNWECHTLRTPLGSIELAMGN